jgi:hypothetical protein
MLGRRGPLSKLVGGTIGLAKEYEADRQSRKEQESDGKPESQQVRGDVHQVQKYDHDIDEEELDDESWAQELNAAQLEATRTQDSTDAVFDEDIWVDTSSRSTRRCHMSINGLTVFCRCQSSSQKEGRGSRPADTSIPTPQRSRRLG